MSTARELPDLSRRRDILDSHDEPIDLSRFSREEQHRIVGEYFEKLSPEERDRRSRIVIERDYQEGRLSRPAYLSAVDPENMCKFGPTQLPRGMTEERLREILTALRDLPPAIQYDTVLAEPPREPEAGEEVPPPISFGLNAHGDPECMRRRSEQQ